MSGFEVIFKYGESDDFEVLKKVEYYNSGEQISLYTVAIEQYIYFERMKDLVSYYKEFLNAYKMRFDVVPIDYSDCIYRSYDIEIIRDVGHYAAYVSCPMLYSEEECYLWMEGVINQLENISTLFKK